MNDKAQTLHKHSALNVQSTGKGGGGGGGEIGGYAKHNNTKLVLIFTPSFLG